MGSFLQHHSKTTWVSVFAAIFLLLSPVSHPLHALPFLYVAQNDGSSSIFDITTPSAPIYQNSASDLQTFALVLATKRKLLYGPSSNMIFLSYWDFTTPGQPIFVQNIPGGSQPWGVLVPSSNPYLSLPGGAVNVFSVYPMFDPADPLGGSSAPLQSVDFFIISPDGNHLYTLQNNTLETIDSSHPLTPILESSIPINSNHLVMHPTGSNLYVIDTLNLVLTVFDLSSPSSPALLPTNLSTGNNPQVATITPSGNYLYVVNQNDNSISIFNIQTPSAPVAEPTLTSPNLSQPYGLISSPDGSTLYVSNQGANTISVFDITSEASPVWVEDLSVSQVPTYMTISAPFPYPFSIIKDNSQ